MNKEYRYFKDNNGKLCRIHIEQDDTPLDPRVDYDGSIGHMMCWHRNYNLGDYKQNNYSDEEDFFKAICEEYLSKEQIEELVNKRMEIVSILEPQGEMPNKEEYEDDIIEMARKYELMRIKANALGLINEAKRYMSLSASYKDTKWKEYNDKLKLATEYKVQNDVGWTYKGTKEECENYIEGELRENLLNGDIFYASSGMYKETMSKLKETDLIMFPLYLLDHSGLSISMSSFCDKWDSGQVGWIYTTKNEIMNCGGKFKSDNGEYIDVTEENWKEAAQIWLEGEVELYDQYLQGDCYGYVIDELNEDGEWDEHVDSCWGFFSDKWGDDLIEEIAKEAVSYELYEEMEDVA